MADIRRLSAYDRAIKGHRPDSLAIVFARCSTVHLCLLGGGGESIVAPLCADHKQKTQRTSGPVNAHLSPGPGIYFKAFIHVYSPGAGADNPLGTNVDVSRMSLSLCPFVAIFKTISLKYDFKHILNDFIYVYSPGARAETPLGTNF